MKYSMQVYLKDRIIHIQETLLHLSKRTSLNVFPIVYSFIIFPTLEINSRTGSNSGCISSAVVT